MWDQMKRGILFFLMAAVCAGIYAGLFFATSLYAAPVSGQKEINPADTSWMDEEVVVQLDENNMDENGFTYEFPSYMEQEARLKSIQISRYQDRRTTIRLRIPDKVVKDGQEYVVTDISIAEDKYQYNVTMKTDFCFYMGREVRDVWWQSVPCASTCYPHRESTYFTEEGGVLFNYDKTELIHFNHEYYGADPVYEIPETVSKIRSCAFEYAQIKEVVLSDRITGLPWECFSHSTLQKIDLKNVNMIGDYAFSSCQMLKEVRIRQEGVSICQRAFAWSGIESLYLPPGGSAECYYDFEGCENLKTVIIGGEFQMEEQELEGVEGLFEGCISLQTVVLPKDLPRIGRKMFRKCMSLRKLYVPDHVTSVGERAFNVEGNLTLYAKDGSPVAAYDDDNVSVAVRDGHEHMLKEVMFMKYDTWGVKGKYCEECAYATGIEVVEFDEGADPDIPVLEPGEDTCSEVLELDENNTDEQGVVYSLDAVNKTASVDHLDDTRPFPKSIIIVPESVEKDGIRYPVEVIETLGLDQADIVVLPDSVKQLKSWSVRYARKLVLGKGVQDSNYAFGSRLHYIEIRGDNPYYRMIDGVLYTRDKKVLLRRTSRGVNYFQKEYKIPTTVTQVMSDAFDENHQLKEIHVYNCGNKEMENLSFERCRAEVCHADGYTWYDLEDTIVDLDSKNQDGNGYVYKLYGADQKAEVVSINASGYDESTGEVTVKAPDMVRKDGRIYKVTTVGVKPADPLPADIRIRLFVGKYVTDIYGLSPSGSGDIPYKITFYINRENKAFTSEQGSLFDRERKQLYRFCDEAFDSNCVYVLPAETVSVRSYAFSGSAIRRVDLNQVQEIGEYSFCHCDSLEEVIMPDEGVSIGFAAFMHTKNLKYVYIPGKSQLSDWCFHRSGLQTVILGEDAEYTSLNSYNSQFVFCENLKTCILPEQLTALPRGLFANCPSLKKVYIPQGVGEVGENCFLRMTGNVCAAEGGVVEESVKNSGTAQFVSLQNHTHHMERVTFFAFDTWAVTGDYCSGCAYAAGCERVELRDENDRADLPPLLETETEVPPPTEMPTAVPAETAVPTETFSPTPTETPGSTETPVPPETVSPAPAETLMPTVAPVVTETPVPMETLMPVPPETVSPAPAETLMPTVTPVVTETAVPAETAVPMETLMPVPLETVSPAPTETLMPTVTPVVTETAVPMETLMPVPLETVSPAPAETLMPTVTPAVTETAVPMETFAPTPTETLTPMNITVITEMPVSMPVMSAVNQNGYIQKLVVKKFQVFSKNNKSARLQWKKNESASLYRIYRSKKKNGKYRIVKTVASNKNFYVDKKIKPMQRYYYKIKALGYCGGNMREGKESSIRSICVSGICNPKISVKKGQVSQIRYVTVCLKKYQGNYADIYISIDRKKFKKLNLVSNKISKYKGKFEIQYVIRNKKIRFKVRTYQKKGRGYSGFSNIVAVRV